MLTYLYSYLYLWNNTPIPTSQYQVMPCHVSRVYPVALMNRPHEMTGIWLYCTSWLMTATRAKQSKVLCCALWKYQEELLQHFPTTRVTWLNISQRLNSIFNRELRLANLCAIRISEHCQFKQVQSVPECGGVKGECREIHSALQLCEHWALRHALSFPSSGSKLCFTWLFFHTLSYLCKPAT